MYASLPGIIVTMDGMGGVWSFGMSLGVINHLKFLISMYKKQKKRKKILTCYQSHGQFVV